MTSPTTTPTPDRGLITLGFGNERYRRMAAGVALSAKLQSPAITCAVVTDAPEDPLLRSSFDLVIELDPNRGSGLEQKLALDLYTPFEETVFIDADSLVARDLDRVFRLLRCSDFGAVGFPVIDGHYWGEVADWLHLFDVPYLGKFNAGLMYFNSAGGRVFETARTFITDGLIDGVPIYRGALLDEIFLSAAMARHGIFPIYDDGSVMRAPEPLESRFILNIQAGQARFRTKGKWVEPAVIHFAYLYHGEGLRGAVYRRELRKLLGETAPTSEWLRCLASQTFFTMERSEPFRRLWKDNRSRLGRSGRSR